MKIENVRSMSTTGLTRCDNKLHTKRFLDWKSPHSPWLEKCSSLGFILSKNSDIKNILTYIWFTNVSEIHKMQVSVK